MPVQYKPSPHAFFTEGESLTEQEFKNSCDINLMMKNALRGVQIRGGSKPVYGFDDTTLDGLQHRINKQRVEEELASIAKKNEFTEEELKSIPKSIIQKFGFRSKKVQESKLAPKNDDLNDKNEPKKSEPPKPDPKP